MNSSDYRKRARISLKGRWFNSSVAYFVYYMLISLVSSIYIFATWLFCFGFLGKTFEELLQDMVKQSPEMKSEVDIIMKDTSTKKVIDFLDHALASLDDLLPVLVAIIIIAFLLYLVVMSMLTPGLYKMYLDTARMGDTKVETIFKNISLFGKMFGLLVVRGLLIGLGYLLIIPGIISTYKYMLAPFILVDNPDMSVKECLKKSSDLVSGKKWNLFVLCLSYIGWLIVAYLVGVIVGQFIPFGTTIALAVVQVYMYVGIAHFYLNNSGQDNTINIQTIRDIQE